ncbi:ATP-binding protein [Vibrio sp. JC009]|uniref:PAS domain-containing sensor histidine kinase n=1 Tax=Vibrio sp. JC009 TaxID=2912314 RepID=UPI0023B0EB09|nr:ATP-binding protein [Vibrio sp. JC009]WED24875.1 ATP-binding protein [Vibrio sp. JC009]
MKRVKLEDSIKSPIFSGIGKRIILIMVLISSTVTLSATLLQLSWDYTREFNAVEARHQEIQMVHVPLLAASLWEFDLKLVQQRLEGLVNLPRINYLEIRSAHDNFTAGKAIPVNRVINGYPVVYRKTPSSKAEYLGTLYVHSDAQEIYDYLIEQFVATLIINGIKTMIVCLVILFVINESINKRIFLIARYLRNYNPRHPRKPLVLRHRKILMSKQDEVKWLGDETNRITNRLTTLYKNIKYEQERFTDFANVSSDWLWETNSDGSLIYVSTEMEKHLSIDPANYPNITELEIFESANNFLGYINDKMSFEFCQEKVEINGVTHYLLLQAIANYHEGEFLGFRGTAIDITVLQKALIDLEELNENLEKKVEERTHDLKASMENLERTQEKLVESEKLAALGGLVSGVAHEVNTPLGISVTAASIIQEIVTELNKAFEAQTLTSTQFSALMSRMNDTNAMLEDNLNRAAKLIRDFKQTAVDQVSESRSQFAIQKVLESLLASLHSRTKKVPVEPEIIGDDKLLMNSLPGVLTQVVSNLILNSVNHAFKDAEKPEITLNFTEDGDNVVFEYRDNGCGVDEALHQKIFEPFYTTTRGRGGSGLGLNLVFNLVRQKLKGSLEFDSKPGEGVKFVFKLPKELPLSLEEFTEE